VRPAHALASYRKRICSVPSLQKRFNHEQKLLFIMSRIRLRKVRYLINVRRNLRDAFSEILGQVCAFEGFPGAAISNIELGVPACTAGNGD
jgi:hypothetical protein